MEVEDDLDLVDIGAPGLIWWLWSRQWSTVERMDVHTRRGDDGGRELHGGAAIGFSGAVKPKGSRRGGRMRGLARVC